MSDDKPEGNELNGPLGNALNGGARLADVMLSYLRTHPYYGYRIDIDEHEAKKLAEAYERFKAYADSEGKFHIRRPILEAPKPTPSQDAPDEVTQPVRSEA